jgi:hypothetical protein
VTPLRRSFLNFLQDVTAHPSSDVTPAPFHTLTTCADELRLTHAAKLLKQTLAEEKKTDETLTGIAKTVVNMKAEAA